ncbi:MAG: hypothetical protein ACI9EK_002561, partial [Psychroserpens sp.]
YFLEVVILLYCLVTPSSIYLLATYGHWNSRIFDFINIAEEPFKINLFKKLQFAHR